MHLATHGCSWPRANSRGASRPWWSIHPCNSAHRQVSFLSTVGRRGGFLPAGGSSRGTRPSRQVGSKSCPPYVEHICEVLARAHVEAIKAEGSRQAVLSCIAPRLCDPRVCGFTTQGWLPSLHGFRSRERRQGTVHDSIGTASIWYNCG